MSDNYNACDDTRDGCSKNPVVDHYHRHRHVRHYSYYYNDFADYQMNASSIEDYLARWNRLLCLLQCTSNRLLDRDILVKDTDSIGMNKDGDWQGSKCVSYDDIITLTAYLKLSKDANNAAKFGSDGALWVLDLEPRVKDLENRVTDLENRVTIIEGDITIIKNQIIDIYNQLKKIGDRLTIIEGDITNIKNDITNIWKVINGLAGGSGTRLTKGTDYSINFHNGFTNTANDMDISVIESSVLTVLRIQTSTQYNTQLSNPNISNVFIRHGQDISSDNGKKSWMFSITFNGSYEYLNNSSRNIPAGGLFTMSPSSQRASWNYTTNTHFNVAGAGKMLFSLTSYADGYNDQFTRYENLSLSTGTFLSEVSFNTGG